MTRELSHMARSISRLLRNRVNILPDPVLNRYLESFLGRRELYLESASRLGTPQYFFDEPALSAQIVKFRETFTRHLARFRVFYAVKSNSFSGICKSAVDAGLGLDVSSGMELSLALGLGCQHVIFSGPGKTDEELRLAVSNRERVTILLDSAGELDRLSALIKDVGRGEEPVRVGIRIRGGHHGIWNKFGVPIDQLAPLFNRAMSTPGVKPQGFQFHTSWNLDPGPQVEMIGQVGRAIKERISESFWTSLTFLDIGGGYWPEAGEWLNTQNTLWGRLIHLFYPEWEFRTRHYYREARPLKDFARRIGEAITQVGPPLSNLEIWMEPGRWISTPAMHILMKVIDRKDSNVVIMDGGINLLGWERPLSEFIPVINLTRPSLKEKLFRIFGPLCTPMDIWGASFFGDGIAPGDVMLVPDQGAYTYSLRQSFIKPRGRVIHYDGASLKEVEREW